MRTGDRLQKRHRSLILSAIAAATMALIVACGGGGSDPAVVPADTPVPTSEAGSGSSGTTDTSGDSSSAPAATASPDTAPTPVTTSAPTAVPSGSTDEAPAAPAATATPEPTPAPTLPVTNVFDGYGFKLQLDADSNFASSKFTLNGWSGESADADQGLVTFSYNGADVVLFWEPGTGGSAKALADATYELQKLSKPSYEFTAINEGDLVVDGQAGKFGGFVYADSAGENASGGLIGAWACPGSNQSISMTATSSDSTALQIRFDRLVSGFECAV